MSVKRYQNWCLVSHGHDLIERPDGLWVKAIDYYALAKAGDVLAHQLMHRDHPELLDRWWNMRGGHSSCTVCCSEGATEGRK